MKACSDLYQCVQHGKRSSCGGRAVRQLARLLCLLALLLVSACGWWGADDGTAPTSPVSTEPAATPPAATATPAPVTIPADELLARALHQRKVGADEAAATDLVALLHHYPDAPEARRAHYFLAESFARRGRWSSASEAFRDFLDEPGDDVYQALALFWLARSYEEMGDWSSAVATYEAYRALETPLEPYAAARQAAQYEALGQPEQAARTYAHVGGTSVQPGERAGSYEKAIALYRQLDQPAEALRLYESLLDFASVPGYRARLLHEAATLAQQLGQPDQAQAWLLEIVTVAPDTSYAVDAVNQLRARENPALTDAEAARVYASAEQYDAALDAFDAALASIPAGSDEWQEVRRQRALTIRAQGDFARALDEFATIVVDTPTSEVGHQAQLDWIQTLGQSGETRQAAERYYDYADINADDWRAPEALDRAAQLYDRLNDRSRAAQIRLELGQRYPQSEQAAPALQQAAWYFDIQQRHDLAQQAWELLSASNEPYERARGAFWAGRLAGAAQDHGRAHELFTLAHEAAPNSYYGVRAGELLGITTEGAVPLGAPFSGDDWQALADWVAAWSGNEADAQAVYDEVRNSDHAQRAIGLQAVGLHGEAIAEWNHAREVWAEDPLRLAWLARLAYEFDMPYIALKAAEQLADTAPADAPPLPLTLERLIFPAPYPELVQTEAAAQGVDPRLFYALVRQESLFNPVATSWVGARGLAQVMPATGEGIAQSLGVTNFQLDDLYRPHISVRFGTYYISQRIVDMEGSIQGGLAAYNGGLGNSLRWADGSNVADPDLFTESIDFPETEHYVKRVYGFYGAYQRIYRLP